MEIGYQIWTKTLLERLESIKFLGVATIVFKLEISHGPIVIAPYRRNKTILIATDMKTLCAVLI